MIEVPATSPGLPALFDAEIPNSPILFAVLHGDNPGRAFADSEANPSHAVVRTDEGLVFLSQTAPQEFLDQALTHLRQSGHVGLIWRPETASPQPPEAARILERREFPTCGAGKETLAALETRLPEGFEFRLIDLSLLERCEWRPEIEGYCGSLENFLAHGLGICLMSGNDIITEAYAPFWGIHQTEIGVVTNEAHRGRGYASVACAHLIRLCRERGFEPYWSCDADNTASISSARKLGFQGERGYEIRLYRGTPKEPPTAV